VTIAGRTLFDKKDLDDLIERAKQAGETIVKKKGSS
jgi:malate/lactate dehydrogenase